MTRRSLEGPHYLMLCLPIVFAASACTPPAPPSFAGGSSGGTAAMQTDQAQQDRISRGRFLVVSHACGDCHGGGSNPAAEGWLAGLRDTITQQFRVGPFVTRAKNLTPDVATGIGSFTERQLFNALRYGLRPEETPDVEITSTVPGKGSFPLHPHYLAIPMPWPSWRHMPDEDLRAIAAYLKNGVKPVSNKVQDSDGPPDFWAGEYTVAKIGPYPVFGYPTAKEKGGR
jgi:alcohol dehydrogenase (quinone), cytochrome c subunit